MKKINMDILRLIASFLIVAIHTYPFTFISETFDYMLTRVLFRIAVPFFLMITGYFVLDKLDKDKLVKYTKKIITLYLISILIYLPLNIYNGYFNSFDILKILKDIFITGTFYHLWYFPASILGLWLAYFFLKNFNLRKSMIVALMLYIIGVLGDSYFYLIADIPFINNFYQVIFSISDYTRNGIFYVPIFIILGYSLRESKCKISKKYIYTIIFFLTLLIEGYLTYHFKLAHHSSMYLSLIPLMYFIFAWTLSLKGTNNRLRTFSTIIYIIHPFFIAIMHFIRKVITLSILSHSLINYLFVLACSIISAIIIEYLIAKIRVKYQ